VVWFEEPDIIVAFIALGASLASAAITAVFTKRNDEKLKRLESELEISRAERDACRDYEYEAKKDYIRSMNQSFSYRIIAERIYSYKEH
jgi:hypothetical protein